MSHSKKIRFDLKWAQTLDGQLSDDFHVSKWISSKEERVETHRLRRDYDAVLVGATTFIKDLCKLTVRDCETEAHEKQPCGLFSTTRPSRRALAVWQCVFAKSLRGNCKQQRTPHASSGSFGKKL
jgi:hypothetical protein